jgi:ankyrin repeat protein
VQIPLMDLLLERGAAIDGVTPGMTIVEGALANGCPDAAKALVDRGARVDTVATAAGVGRLDLVRQLADSATKADLEKALVFTGWYGTIEIMEYLLDRGVDAGAYDGSMTALHSAAGRANIGMTKLLIERGAPLEKKNGYGGTVLDSTLWFAYNSDPADFAQRDFPAVIDILLAAGAKDDLYPEMKGEIQALRTRRH